MMVPDIAIVRKPTDGAARISNISTVSGLLTIPNIIRTTMTLAIPPGHARAAVVGEFCHVAGTESTLTYVMQCTPAHPPMTRDAIVRNSIETLQELLSASRARIWICTRDLPLDSRDLWHILDHFHSPRVGLWLDLETLLGRGETPSVFLAQLAQFTQAVAWRFEALTPLARGELSQGLSREIEILKGVAYRGLLVIDDAPDEIDPQASLADAMVVKLRELWCTPVVVLAAYKGDKHAPKFAAR